MENFDIIERIVDWARPVITGIAGWWTGRRKQKNDFLSDLQSSIDLLSARNAELIKQVTELNATVIGLKAENSTLKAEIKAVREENQQMSDEITRLREKLDGVKTITRVKKDENK